FVPNATSGVNAVVRSLDLRPGDEILASDHAYNACRNALDFVAERAGARIVTVPVPFPLKAADQVVDAFLSRVGPHTRLALVYHITSPTALVLPIETLAGELARRGVDVLVDGAHAPGMVPLEIERMGIAYYTANCHKWICAPKGAAFLYVRPDLQQRVRPLTISHGANSTRRDRSRFQLEFDWTGTHDVTPQLCVGPAIRFLRDLVPGGWPEIIRHNRELALEARRHLCERLGVESPAPEDMIGSMATIPLPDAARPLTPLFLDPLQEELWQEHRIEVVVNNWPAPPTRHVRISAALYNAMEEYRRLGDALEGLLAREKTQRG
ncbi:MAG: aminotransferase class V-fold PLP-dependent enzyme, partial [Candidatus Eisenbacteria bacterium]|nr:aminotransferase class V-fold PLP-dependent enzyme [Candidatus Eisenbacteria bacterium]